MPRVIVYIHDSWDGRPVFEVESPKGHPKAGKIYPLKSDPAESPFSDMRLGDGSPERVREAGEKLFADLMVHPAVPSALDTALGQLQGGHSPICFRLDEAGAESLPWEAFRAGANKFLALDDRWPIIRVREVSEAIPVPVYEFAPPVRIVAILSVTGSTSQTRASGAPQWTKMEKTLGNHLKAKGVPVRLTVLTCEEDLRDTINAAGIPGTSADLIADKEDLLTKIADAQPNLLHFFCHGTSEESPHLSIGTRTDWEAERDGSIALDASELRQRADNGQKVWLITLNCCESATRARDARSLANSLVAAGFPAALGMREAIDVETAHLLCEHFYPAVLGLIGSIHEGERPEIEWATALFRARSALVGAAVEGVLPQDAAKGSKTWTIPALYTRREPFYLKRIPGAISEARQHIIDCIRTLMQQRTTAAEDYKDLPPQALSDILSGFDKKVAEAEKELAETP